MNENIFRITLGILFLAALIMTGYFRRKADRESGERVSIKDEGRPMFLALRLGGLTLWLSILAYLINPSWMAWSKMHLPEWARWLGVLGGIVSWFLLLWMLRSIGSGITPTVATRKTHKLVKTGPYRFIRHPLYSFSTALFLSFAALADNWFFAAGALIALTLIALRLPNEEAHLIEKFGDEYRQYMESTGAFLPRL